MYKITMTNKKFKLKSKITGFNKNKPSFNLCKMYFYCNFEVKYESDIH